MSIKPGWSAWMRVRCRVTRPAGELLRLVVRPQEVVAAIIALNVAFEQYSAAVNEYNAAQFPLYRALGQPAQWVTSRTKELRLFP